MVMLSKPSTSYSTTALVEDDKQTSMYTYVHVVGFVASNYTETLVTHILNYTHLALLPQEVMGSSVLVEPL